MALRIAAPSALLLLAWLAQPAAAQGQPSEPPSGAVVTATPAESASAPEVAKSADAAQPAVAPKVPVDLARLQQRLRDSAERDAQGAPKLRFDVSVYAWAPRIQIFTPEDNLRYGQPRRSAPTHQDMMNLVTPQPFRHMPTMGLGSVINWLQGDKR